MKTEHTSLLYYFNSHWLSRGKLISCAFGLSNPLTVVPESHTGNDHALFDLFHAYFTAIESTKEQPTI